jgi:3'-phosphoadenosine 5'-phosphosulfate sulfotransferase (PAPS reductase)/FAD synthetase
VTTPERIAAIDRALAAKVRLNALMGYGLDRLVNLHDFDIVIVNSSGGKDSIVALWQMVQMADAQGYDRSRIHVSHQDLGKSEWPGVTALVHEQAAMFGLPVHVTRRRTQEGKEETLLEYARRRGKWPSSAQRWCTSDFKRAPGARVLTGLARDHGAKKILQVFGFRAEESPSRSKRPVLGVNTTSTTQSRTVIDYLPVHDWAVERVWSTIRSEGLPYHYAYDLGMPRLSCMFCIFAPREALAIAGRENPEALQEYVDAERAMGHTFKADLALADVQRQLQEGYEPVKVADWAM